MNFRNILNRIAGSMVILAIAAVSHAAPAQANTLRQVEQIGTMVGIIPPGCIGLTGLWQAQCYVQQNRAQRQMREIRERGDAMQMRANIQQRELVLRELTEACQLGDRWSCERVSRMEKPLDPRIIQIVQRLENACQRGDRESCRRLTDNR